MISENETYQNVETALSIFSAFVLWHQIEDSQIKKPKSA